MLYTEEVSMNDPFTIEGKVALVTGAATGIGRATALQLAKAGAQVMLTDINRKACAQAAAEFAEAGLQAASLHHNVSQEEDWKNVVASTLETFGGLDVLVNNAGILIGGMLLNTSLEQVQKLNSVNIESVFLGTKHAAEAMKPGGAAGNGGSIINLSSVAGIVGVPGHSAYGATKGAVRLYTKHAAVEFARLGYDIRVNSVHPGVTATAMGDQVFQEFVDAGLAPDIQAARKAIEQMIPMGFLGESRDIAHMIQFLASDASRYCTGAEFVVDGGLAAS